MQNDKTTNVSEFVEKVRRYTEITELTPAIVNEFIDYIMVSKKQMIDGKTVYPIDIYYSGIGIIDAPSAEEYEEMYPSLLYVKGTKGFFLMYHYATLLFASSANAAKPSASFTAISASILRLISTPATFKPCINWL